MGYYSDVGLCLSKKGVASLKKALGRLGHDAEATELDKEAVQKLLCLPSHMSSPSGACAWYWECMKWYEDFYEVRFVDSLLSALEPADYSFIRLGEDHDDTEWRGDFYDNPFNMRISRVLCFD